VVGRFCGDCSGFFLRHFTLKVSVLQM
jgi:hypothetical protein